MPDRLEKRRRISVVLLQLFDLLILVVIGRYFATSLVQEIAERSVGRGLLRLIVVTCLTPVVWHLCHLAAGVYRSHRISTPGQLLAEIVTAIAASFAVILACFSVIVRMSWPLNAVIEAFPMAVLLSFTGRLGLRYGLVRMRRHGRNLRSVLVVGSNSRSVSVAKMLEDRADLGFRVIGFVDDEWEGLEQFRKSHYKIVSGLESLPAYLRQASVDEVFIWLPVRSCYDKIREIAAHCSELGIISRFPGQMMELNRSVAYIDSIGGQHLWSIGHTRLEGFGLVVKSCLDRVLALAALILLSPVMLLIAAVVKLTSRGPVLFCQNRLGLHKRVFRVLKFRTMVADAESRLPQIEHLNEVKGAAFKMTRDPRITRVGNWLRRSSLDELPQLINVLKGDMSMVGPRPLPLRDYEKISEDWQLRRLSVRPGISCLWQVGGRHRLSFDKWMQLDLDYIEGWSLWLDIKILAKTAVAVVRGEGAW